MMIILSLIILALLALLRIEEIKLKKLLTSNKHLQLMARLKGILPLKKYAISTTK